MLSVIPADIGREQWLSVAMGIHQGGMTSCTDNPSDVMHLSSSIVFLSIIIFFVCNGLSSLNNNL
jgi:hypothetical protein